VKEKLIEQYLRDEIKKVGGKAYKFTSPGNSGVPDRLILLPGGRVFFIESKATGKASTPLQKRQQKLISDLGFYVAVIDSKEGVDAFMSMVKR